MSNCNSAFTQSLGLLNRKLADEDIYDLYELNNGELLIATSKGLVHAKREASLQLSISRYFEGYQFWEIFKDSSNALWLIGNNPFLIRLSSLGIARIPLTDSTGQMPFRALGPGVSSSFSGRLQIPTVTGIISLDGMQFEFEESQIFLGEKARLLYLNDTTYAAPLYIYNSKRSKVFQFASPPSLKSRNYKMFHSSLGVFITHTFDPMGVWFVSRTSYTPKYIRLNRSGIRDGEINFLGSFYDRLWFSKDNSVTWFKMSGDWGGEYHLPGHFIPTKIVPSTGGGIWVLSMHSGIEHIGFTELNGNQFIAGGQLGIEISLVPNIGAAFHDRNHREVRVYDDKNRCAKFVYNHSLPKLWSSTVVNLFGHVFIASEEWLPLGNSNAHKCFKCNVLSINPRYVETRDSLGLMLTYKGVYGLTLNSDGKISTYKISTNTFSQASIAYNGAYLANSSGLWFSERRGHKFFQVNRLNSEREPISFIETIGRLTFIQQNNGVCFFLFGGERLGSQFMVDAVVKTIGYSSSQRTFFILTSNSAYKITKQNNSSIDIEKSSFLASISGIVKSAIIIKDKVFLIRQNHLGESLWSFYLMDLFLSTDVNFQTKNLKDFYQIPESNPVLNLGLTTTASLTTDSIYFMWKLKGVSNEWLSFDGSSIDFAGYKPGEYNVLIIQHSAGHILDSDIFLVSITRPIYRDPLFWVVCLSFLIFVLVAFFVWRFNTLAAKALLEVRLLQLDRKVFGSRLNAHFVFNTLNNLKCLVENNRKNEASYYLSKFSKVLRSFLEQTFSDMSTVNKEAHFLMDYLTLEKMRFPELFEFTIRSESEISEHEFPSSIIQPFVENCLKHAILKRINGKGHIDVYFFKPSGYDICVEITDNGSGELHAENLGTVPSGRGLQIVYEHLELLRKLNRWDVHFQAEFDYTGSKITILANKIA